MRVLLIFLFFFFSLSSLAETSDNFLAFQIIQDQITFDNTVVQQAALEMSDLNVFTGLLIELKPNIAESFTQMTKAGVTKTANIVLNKKIIASAVIHSALGGKISITGLTRQEAEQFLLSLRENDKK